MADSFELLIDLGVDTEASKKNINDAIKALKNLDTVKVQLEVDGTKEVDTSFKSLQQQIKNLESEILSLNKALNSTGNNKGLDDLANDIDRISNKTRDLDKNLGRLGDSNSGKLTGNIDKELVSTFRSLDELFDYLDRKELKFSISRNSVNEVTKVITTIKNELGQLETLSIKPNVSDIDGNINSFNVNSKLTDDSTFKLRENIDKSIAKLDELSKKGLIVGDNLEKYLNDLNTAKSNDEVRKLTDEFTKLSREISLFDNNRIALEKFNSELDKLERKGSITSNQKQQFIDEANLVTSVTELKLLQTTVRDLANESKDLATIDNTLSKIEPTVERLNSKLDVTVSKLGDNLDSTKLEKVRQQLDDISNFKINNLEDINVLNTQIANTEKAITQLTVAGNNTERVQNAITKATTALDDLERKGYSADKTLSDFRDRLANLPANDLSKVKDLLKDIKDEASNVKLRIAEQNDLRILEGEINKIQAQLDKTKNLYANTFDQGEALKLTNVINRLREEIDKTTLDSINGTTITRKRVDELKSSLTAVNSQVKQFNALATTSARNSTGILDSLRTAFQKFPVWLLATNAFYGAINGFQDLTDKVIELDTALTNLRRVSGADDFEINQVIDRAIVSTTELSGRLDEFLELVSEFSRTGKTINESFDLAETTQQLVNISDLDAGQSVDALTAAMIAFNIEASDSVRIADKLNEVNIIISLLLW